MSPHEVRSIGMRVQDRVRAQFSWPLESDRESAMMLLQSVNSLSSKVPDWTEEEREKVRSFLARAKENGISVTESEDGFGDWTGSSGEDDDADADEDEDSV